MQLSFKEAIADYTKAIEIDPGFAEAYLNRGLAHWLQGHQAEAERDFDRCLKLNSDLKPLLEERVREMKRRLDAKQPGPR